MQTIRISVGWHLGHVDTRDADGFLLRHGLDPQATVDAVADRLHAAGWKVWFVTASVGDGADRRVIAQTQKQDWYDRDGLPWQTMADVFSGKFQRPSLQQLINVDDLKE